MKNVLLTLCFISAATFALAQSDSIPPSNDESKILLNAGEDGLKLEVQTIDTVTGQVKDTTKISIGTSTVLIINDDSEMPEECKEDIDRSQRHKLTYWNGIDLGFNSYVDADFNYDLGEENEMFELDEFASRTISLNFGETKLRLIKDYVGITTGLGVQYNSYKFKNDYTFFKSRDTLTAFVDSTISLKKNKLRTGWVNVPLLLEFNTSLSQSNNVHLAAGVVGGWNFGNMYKQKLKRDGEREKRKVKDEWHVNDFKLEAMVRLGYKSFNLFATYQVTELFDTDKALALHPVTVGLTVVAF